MLSYTEKKRKEGKGNMEGYYRYFFVKTRPERYLFKTHRPVLSQAPSIGVLSPEVMPSMEAYPAPLTVDINSENILV